MIPESRPITPDELQTVQIAFERAPREPLGPELATSVSLLKVRGRCECGCASIEFEGDSENEEKPRLLADAVGNTQKGGRVGIIVWGTSKTVTGLEIYSLGAESDDLGLPVLSTVRSWSEGQ